jgi:hypothetical protein
MMFSPEERDRVRERLLQLARTDSAVTGAAITGSYAADGGDRWSDIDLAFGIRGSLTAALDRWAERLHDEFCAVHHWDLPSDSAVYRVFLLPDWLEVDIGFFPAAEFGPGGPSWRTVFGETVKLGSPAEPTVDYMAGLAWHHVLHARVSIERKRHWQAEHWISAVRDQVLSLACLRLGYPTAYAKGAHLLPAELTAPLEAALIRKLNAAELLRALTVSIDSLAAELDRTDPELAARLRPMLAQLSAS